MVSAPALQLEFDPIPASGHYEGDIDLNGKHLEFYVDAVDYADPRDQANITGVHRNAIRGKLI